jgi:hypothetical protein
MMAFRGSRGAMAHAEASINPAAAAAHAEIGTISVQIVRVMARSID